MKIRYLIIVPLILLILPLCFSCNGEDVSGKEDYILNLPPMKDHFAKHFMIGNIMNPSDAGSNISNPFLTHHFNVLTCENEMKPDKLGNKQWTNADRMVDAAIKSGFKVVGHTLLWHSQNASWMNSSVNKTQMENYIKEVVGRYKGRIHSWDVLNEAFPDGGYTSDWKTSIRPENPWFKSIGSDFVYEGFLAARFADPKAILYYNDYNTDQVGKATMIRNMVLEVNNKYIALPSDQKPAGEEAGRLLIEGIGMQEHHNLGVNANNIRNTLTMFKNMTFTGSTKKIIVSVSELDVLSQSWNDYSNKKSITDQDRASQAVKYGEYMKVYIEFRDIIERVSLWGVTDDKSWRARGEPLLFEANGLAKPAYHSFVGALQ